MSLDAFIQQFSGLTEEYPFYNGEVTLVYEPKSHTYFLRTESGELEPQYGVTSVCHIIDKSEALIPWAVKMMASKLLLSAPTMTLPAGDRIVRQMTFAEYEALVLAAKSAHKEKLEDAGKVGHIAHAWIEDYIKAELVADENAKLRLLANFPFDERSRNACYAALDWMKRHNVRWLLTERKIYSRRYKYAGTMDGLCVVDSCGDPRCCPKRFKNRLSVADWKTSNFLYPEYLLQTAAYLFAYNEQSSYESRKNPKAVDRWVIRLGKDDGEFQTWHAGKETSQTDFKGFLLALQLKQQYEGIKARVAAREKAIRESVKAEKKAAKEASIAAAKILALQKREEKKAATAARLAETKAAKLKAREEKQSRSMTVSLSDGTHRENGEPQVTIGQWSDYICLNYTGLITHTPETCDCGDSDVDKEVPVFFDSAMGTTYINSPVCERCHPIRTANLRPFTLQDAGV